MAALQALDVVVQRWLQTEYPFGPSAVAFKTEARTLFALKKTCKRLNAHDSTEWELGEDGVCFCYAEALEEAKFDDPERACPQPLEHWDRYCEFFPNDETSSGDDSFPFRDIDS